MQQVEAEGRFYVSVVRTLIVIGYGILVPRRFRETVLIATIALAGVATAFGVAAVQPM